MKLKEFIKGVFGPVRYDDKKIREMAFSSLPKEILRSLPPNIFINDKEYEWWCTSNTCWEEWGYYNAPYGTIYDVYRLVHFDKLAREQESQGV